MNKTATILAILATSSTAFAGGWNHKWNSPEAHSFAAAGAIAGAQTKAKQTNRQTNAQQTVYNEAKQDFSNTYEDYRAPAYAPSVQATTPCLVPVNVGVSGGIGVSFGSGVLDEGCEMRETARLGLLSDNASTRALADQVLQTKLRGYIVKRQPVQVDDPLAVLNYE